MNAVAATETIELETPIKRGETEITTLTLRRPKAGELRGLSMSQVLAMQTESVLTLIPRIAEPILTPPELNQLDPSDLVAIGYTILGMVAPKHLRTQLSM